MVSAELEKIVWVPVLVKNTARLLPLNVPVLLKFPANLKSSPLASPKVSVPALIKFPPMTMGPPAETAPKFMCKADPVSIVKWVAIAFMPTAPATAPLM